jgi:hypothetical protein
LEGVHVRGFSFRLTAGGLWDKRSHQVIVRRITGRSERLDVPAALRHRS